jgi:hypothetical protein
MCGLYGHEAKRSTREVVTIRIIGKSRLPSGISQEVH